jgi:hypothetical protein
MVQHKKIRKLIGLLILSVLLTMFSVTSVLAEEIPPGCPGGAAGPVAPGIDCDDESTWDTTSRPASDCVQLGVPLSDGEDCIGSAGSSDIEDNPIIHYLKGIIRFLSAGVGLVVTAMIIVSGIQYMGSRGNPQMVEAAKKRLSNAIIALFLYIFMTAILNFLIPGGLIG